MLLRQPVSVSVSPDFSEEHFHQFGISTGTSNTTTALPLSTSSSADLYDSHSPLLLPLDDDPKSSLYLTLDDLQFMSQSSFNPLDSSIYQDGTRQYINTSAPSSSYDESSPRTIPTSTVAWTPQLSWQQPSSSSSFIEQAFPPELSYPWLQMPSHQRAYSSGSIQSHASLSPYSAGSTFQHPSAIIQSRNQLLTSPQDHLNSPTSLSQHLPTPNHTPTHTPTLDSMQRSNPRRTTSSAKVDPATVAQQAFRGSLSSQPSLSRSASSRYGSGNGSGLSQDLPITPKTANGDDFDAQASNVAIGEIDDDEFEFWDPDLLFDEPVVTRHIPKFDRTMSDIYQDELYDPSNMSAAVTSAPIQNYDSQFLSSNQAMIERLQQANQARIPMSQSQRQVSPFRQDSEWAATGNGFSADQNRIHTAAGLRERQKAENDEFVYQQHHPSHAEPEPNTVSPKDAFPMEMNAGEEDLPSLFPSSSQQSANGESFAYGRSTLSSQPQFNFNVPASSYSFATPSVPASVSIQGTSNAIQYRPESRNSVERQTIDFPAHLPSMETTKSEEDDDDEDIEESTEDSHEIAKPFGTMASSGTYTCTYHGCSRRFSSPPQLQKHKREDHRTTGAQDSTHSDQSAMTQAGPHKCLRKNPSTGRPCNTVFSRPYDLTRHEDTIHAERKKVRCPHCTEEKLFSRADALTRHLRVVHPHIAFPTKHRRRAGAA